MIEGFGTVAVVGTGTIGFGWAHVFCRGGLPTRVYDAEPAQLESLRERLRRGLDLFVEEGLLADAAAAEAAFARVSYHVDLDEALEGVDYVQESVPEQLEVKRAVFEAVDARTPPQTVIGSSASGIGMTDIAARVRHPERCLVVHPTNPPHVVPLVELVPGERTDLALLPRVRAFMAALGQVPIVCRKEVFGFVLNRLQFALEREAFHLAREGVASVADIDRTIRDGLGLRWALLGPYGVEHTNAASVEDDLRKFGQAIQDLWRELCDHLEGPTEEDIALAVEGIRELYGDTPHERLLEYRDRNVLRIRALKAREEPRPPA